MTRPVPLRNISGDSATVPELTRATSPDSIRSPITPGTNSAKQYPFPEPHSAPASTTTFKTQESELKSKDLPFLKHDPYALDDDIIPFDKNKPIVPSRSGSVKSFMSSSSSIKSLKRGLGTIKRKLSRKGSRRAMTQPKPQVSYYADDGITPINRTQTMTQGVGTFKGPQRVDTYQVGAMAF